MLALIKQNGILVLIFINKIGEEIDFLSQMLFVTRLIDLALNGCLPRVSCNPQSKTLLSWELNRGCRTAWVNNHLVLSNLSVFSLGNLLLHVSIEKILHHVPRNPL